MKQIMLQSLYLEHGDGEDADSDSDFRQLDGDFAVTCIVLGKRWLVAALCCGEKRLEIILPYYREN